MYSPDFLQATFNFGQVINKLKFLFAWPRFGLLINVQQCPMHHGQEDRSPTLEEIIQRPSRDIRCLYYLVDTDFFVSLLSQQGFAGIENFRHPTHTASL